MRSSRKACGSEDMRIALPGRIQIAGVIDQADAERIIESGADMLGFPLGLKDGREDLGVEEAAKIVERTSSRVTSVCITYLDNAAEIAALCNQLGARWVQLHGPVELSQIEHLKAIDPDLGIIKSLIVRPDFENALLSEVKKFEPIVDAFITDTYDPETGRTGATGKTHDWAVSRKLVRLTEVPVILAGGLTPDNVSQAIDQVRPFAVDVHTGVENIDGFKSRKLVEEFVRSAIGAL
ncbi:MAG TPA: phosphoribosylanthranilate isomerase [Xanthomonadales bacterium]|nr:phosphoribosylanthranilate isomerase [Xanthomonadales bacterium]